MILFEPANAQPLLFKDKDELFDYIREQYFLCYGFKPEEVIKEGKHIYADNFDFGKILKYNFNEPVYKPIFVRDHIYPHKSGAYCHVCHYGTYHITKPYKCPHCGAYIYWRGKE